MGWVWVRVKCLTKSVAAAEEKSDLLPEEASRKGAATKEADLTGEPRRTMGVINSGAETWDKEVKVSEMDWSLSWVYGGEHGRKLGHAEETFGKYCPT